MNGNNKVIPKSSISLDQSNHPYDLWVQWHKTVDFFFILSIWLHSNRLGWTATTASRLSIEFAASSHSCHTAAANPVEHDISKTFSFGVLFYVFYKYSLSFRLVYRYSWGMFVIWIPDFGNFLVSWMKFGLVTSTSKSILNWRLFAVIPNFSTVKSKWRPRWRPRIERVTLTVPL